MVKYNYVIGTSLFFRKSFWSKWKLAHFLWKQILLFSRSGDLILKESGEKETDLYNIKGNLGAKLRSLLLSWNASSVVQGRKGDGVSVQGGPTKLDTQLELLDGRDAA